MSETAASPAHNKTVLILLGAIAALLFVIVAILVISSAGDDVPAPTVTATTETEGTTAPVQNAAPPAEFDPATAVQVPEDEVPEDFVAAYYESVLAGEYEDAFYRQPAHKQVGTVEEFAGTLQGYDVVSYEVTAAEDQGETYVVVVDQQTGQYGTFENQWVFTLYDGAWLLQDKAVTGMR